MESEKKSEEERRHCKLDSRLDSSSRWRSDERSQWKKEE